ncbi:hypothetical protein [Pseudoalteromonas byunsanensis]|uniref:Uncharacterized protein n=1 Tax=Pseudoalteromonas byunsanensis TaxID=327939 RepID=A0A1S1N006_9GAMM|nr:hypothetical protein [Pseudoalteromonas byunsanensis]OHU94523.1 hypothetical protein BIW53_15775 [Pseudoalteromonas byunsanensis]
MRSLCMSLLICALMLGCEMIQTASNSGSEVPLVNADRSMDWFMAHSLEQVLEAHEAKQSFGLIALNRRGYFYPKVGMARKPLPLKEGCQTWLLSASNDVIKNDSQREQMANLQSFAAKFNIAMESKCLP